MENPWKVDFRMSAEGDNTIMLYQICYKSGVLYPTAAKQTESVVCGSGAKYFYANNNAYNKYIYLRARNNNDVDKVYNIKGYWDEETGGTI